MKKFIFLLAASFLMSCGSSGTSDDNSVQEQTAELSERGINNIQVSHYMESGIPFEKYDIDFKNKKIAVLVREGIIGRPDEVKSDSPVIKTLSDDAIIDFIEAVKENGFENWETEYIDYGVLDGHQWRISVYFSDGTTKEIEGSNAYPATWDKMSRAFKNLTGENILRQ